MKENDPNKEALDSAADAGNGMTEGADKETTDIGRRRFFGDLATVLGTAAVIGGAGLASDKDPVEAKEVKSKILSRIQQQLKQEQGEEGMVYVKSRHGEYLKSSPPPEPITPIVT